MSFCSYCGEVITFRYIGGRCIPLHSTGACTAFKSKKFTDFTEEHHAPESVCRKTNCPICCGPVFFVRHNGGSVWLDAPLGSPWTKHGCFTENKNSSPELIESVLNIDANLDIAIEQSELAGVVRYARVMAENKTTECILENGNNGACLLDVKNNAGYLLGHLCEINKEENTISPSDAPELKYVIKRIVQTKIRNATFCHICKSEVSHKNIGRHLRLIHQLL